MWRRRYRAVDERPSIGQKLGHEPRTRSGVQKADHGDRGQHRLRAVALRGAGRAGKLLCSRSNVAVLFHV